MLLIALRIAAALPRKFAPIVYFFYRYFLRVIFRPPPLSPPWKYTMEDTFKGFILPRDSMLERKFSSLIFVTFNQFLFQTKSVPFVFQ